MGKKEQKKDISHNIATILKHTNDQDPECSNQ